LVQYSKILVQQRQFWEIFTGGS